MYISPAQSCFAALLLVFVSTPSLPPPPFLLPVPPTIFPFPCADLSLIVLVYLMWMYRCETFWPLSLSCFVSVLHTFGPGSYLRLISFTCPIRRIFDPAPIVRSPVSSVPCVYWLRGLLRLIYVFVVVGGAYALPAMSSPLSLMSWNSLYR